MFSASETPSSMLQVNSTGNTKCALKGPQSLGTVTRGILAAGSPLQEDQKVQVRLWKGEGREEGPRVVCFTKRQASRVVTLHLHLISILRVYSKGKQVCPPNHARV